MADAGAPFAIRLEDLCLVDEGGTRRVYLHPGHPGFVFKRFKEPPSDCYLAALGDHAEFADYLVGRARLVEVALDDGDGGRREMMVRQPYVEGLRRGIPIAISYWELQPDLADGAARIGDAGRIGGIVAETEANAAMVAELFHRSPHFAGRLASLYARILAYLDRTGMFLDFAGRNVVAVRGADWDIEVVDGLKGDLLAPPARDEAAEPSLLDTGALINICVFFRMMFFWERLLGEGALCAAFGSCWEAAHADLQSGAHRRNLATIRILHPPMPG